MSAPSPKRQFAAVQRYGRCRWNTGRSVNVADTAAPDPWLPSSLAVRAILSKNRFVNVTRRAGLAATVLVSLAVVAPFEPRWCFTRLLRH
jgi:hypothetical protein